MFKYSYKKGFTLIEMMVSVSIFSMVMVISTGALLSIIDANKKAQSQQAAFSNLDFALESMSRSIRVGTSFRCLATNFSTIDIGDPLDCVNSNGEDNFAFEPFGGDSANDGDQVVYKYNNDPTYKRIERSTDGGATFIPLTSPEVSIEDLTFYVTGAKESGNHTLQPLVTIFISGSAGAGKSKVDFNLQTTVVQRLLDIEL